ncbi:MAG: beta-ketoacyl synthase chain length factor [Succinivibrionaceae bacterium]|nr:beta-ketoacyl synthase chain length factor [Succinivibrionaceae bacterium]
MSDNKILYVHDLYFVTDTSSYKIDDSLSKNPIDKDLLVKKIPMMIRRRLHLAGRFMVGSILSLLENYPSIALISASRTGETMRCINLLKEALNDNTVSPMEFSASVHNANVGISSIASHFNGETIAIAAGKDTLYSGLIEAYISLKDNEIPTQNNYVILSFYEENLNDQNFMDVSSDKSLIGPWCITLALSLNKVENEKEALFSIALDSEERVDLDYKTLAILSNEKKTSLEFFNDFLDKF